MAVLFTAPFVTALNLSGLPIAGATLTFYATGTSTLAVVYADAALTTPLTNPVAADAAGRFPAIYLDPAVAYRALLKDAAGATIRDTDPVAAGDAALRSDLAATTGATLVRDALGNTLQASAGYRAEIIAEEYGVRADCVVSAGEVITTAGTDNAAILNALLATANGRVIRLPGGAGPNNRIRIGSALTRSGSGTLPGPAIAGKGFSRSIVLADFNGDAAVNIDGTGTLYTFFEGGGFTNWGLRAASGRAVTHGVKLAGWWNVNHLYFYVSGFTNGVFPNIPTVWTGQSPDAVQTTQHQWVLCSFTNNGTGIRATTNQGAAKWQFALCTIQANTGDGVLTDSAGWQFVNNSIAFNGTGGVGYGLRIDNSATGASINNLFSSNNEIDGNRSGGIYTRGVQFIYGRGDRFITRYLNGAECSLKHFTIDPAGICSAMDYKGIFHRVETVLNAQQPLQTPTSPVTFYDVGDGSLNSIFGLDIGVVTENTGIVVTGALVTGSPTMTGIVGTANIQVGQSVVADNPSGRFVAGTTVVSKTSNTITFSTNALLTSASTVVSVQYPRTYATAAITNPKYLGGLTIPFGKALVADRAQLKLFGTVSQDFTAGSAPLLLSMDDTGWLGQWNGATGMVTVTQYGHLRAVARGSFSGIVSGDDLEFRLNKNGALIGGAIAYMQPVTGFGRQELRFEWAAMCVPGDTFQIVMVGNAARVAAGPIYGSFEVV